MACASPGGEFVARMDSDDVAEPNRLEEQVRELRKSPELAVLGSEVEIIASDGSACGPRCQPTEHLEIRRCLVSGNGGAMTHGAVVMRRKALDQVGGYDERFFTAQDLDLFIRLSEIGRLRNLPGRLLRWRQHPASINHTMSETWMAMKRMAISSCIQRIGADAYAQALFPVLERFRPFEALSTRQGPCASPGQEG